MLDAVMDARMRTSPIIRNANENRKLILIPSIPASIDETAKSKVGAQRVRWWLVER